MMNGNEGFGASTEPGLKWDRILIFYLHSSVEVVFIFLTENKSGLCQPSKLVPSNWFTDQ
jgi:hypothetical protein